MNIYLLRHGEAQKDESGRDEPELTPRGRKQADLLGRRLAGYGIERLYSSDMTRAVQTAREIDKYLKAGTMLRQGLREIDMGECRNGWDSVRNRNPDFPEKFAGHETDMPYPGGECGKDVWLRAFPVIEEIINTQLKNVAVVTHGGTIRALICGLLGLGQEKRFFIGAPLENCSISTIQYDKSDRRFYVHTVNDCAHLEEDEQVPFQSGTGNPVLEVSD